MRNPGLEQLGHSGILEHVPKESLIFVRFLAKMEMKTKRTESSFAVPSCVDCGKWPPKSPVKTQGVPELSLVEVTESRPEATAQQSFRRAASTQRKSYGQKEKILPRRWKTLVRCLNI